MGNYQAKLVIEASKKRLTLKTNTQSQYCLKGIDIRNYWLRSQAIRKKKKKDGAGSGNLCALRKTAELHKEVLSVIPRQVSKLLSFPYTARLIYAFRISLSSFFLFFCFAFSFSVCCCCCFLFRLNCREIRWSPTIFLHLFLFFNVSPFCGPFLPLKLRQTFDNRKQKKKAYK